MKLMSLLAAVSEGAAHSASAEDILLFIVLSAVGAFFFAVTLRHLIEKHGRKR